MSPSDYSPIQDLVLEKLVADENYIKFFSDRLLHKELDQFNEKIAHQKFHVSKGGLIARAYGGWIDLSKLFKETNAPSETIYTRILKSHAGVRLAKSGDKNITLVVSSDPAIDYNGAFSLLDFESNVWPALQQISEYYPVHYIDAHGDEQLSQYSREAKEKIGNIKIMALSGHGDRYGFRLGDGAKGAINVNPQARDNLFFSTALLKREPLPIDSDGTLILKSCSGGSGRTEDSLNLVNQMASTHLGVEVVGLDRSEGAKLIVNDVVNRKFSFQAWGGEDVAYRVKYLKGFCFPFPSFCLFKLPFGATQIENP